MKRDLKGLVKRGMAQSAPRPNHPIEKIMLSSAGFSRQPTDAQVDDMSTTVAAAMKPLLGIAMSGNVHAIRRVIELAANVSSEAMMLACMHQEAANQVARERTTWPLNISSDPTERRRALRLITGARRLPLGGKTPPRRAVARPSNFTTPANGAVLMAIKAIEIERAFRVPTELFPVLQPEWSVAAAQLPELDGTGGVVDQWFEVIWMYICHRHRGTPEKSALRKLGDPDAKSAGVSGSPDPVLRGRIRHALREAFLRMLRTQAPRRTR